MTGENNRAAQPIDTIVGLNLKRYRKSKKMSQTDLGEAVGVSFQQIQKYEKGTNRIGASRLWQFSDLLHAPIESFYQGISDDLSGGAENTDNRANDGSHAIHPLFMHPHGLALADAFLRLNNPELETQVLALCEVLSRQATNRAA